MADAPPSYGPSPGPPPTYPAPGSEVSGGAIPMVSGGNAGFSETQAPLPAREAAAQAPISPGALADGTGAHPPRRDARDEAIFALQESLHVAQSDLFSLRSTARALERARAEIVAGREEAASQAEEIGTLKARIAAVNTRQGDDVAQRAEQAARIVLLEKAARDANKATYARIVMSKLGEKLDKPTTILCDAEAALRAAAGETSVNRLKHSLRRAAIVRERVLDGEIELAHIPDVANAVDIFTK